MQAIGVHIIRNNPRANVLYVSSEMFTNELITSINEKKTRAFRNKYRKVDVLLIDDIQFLEGKEATQEEFFYTFETLYQGNKQIVITSDCPAAELKGIEERLRTRFSCNMTADIQKPDYETRVAILEARAKKDNVEITPLVYNTLCLIAEQVRDNVRDLEGAYTRVMAYAKMFNEEITPDIAKSILKDVIRINDHTFAPERIRSTVAKYYGISIADMDSKKRKAEITLPRMIAMYLLRNEADMSLSKIGKMFGNRHYSTVIHAVDKIEAEIEEDSELSDAIEAIRSQLGK